MIISSRKLEFDAAHRLVDHENKCKYLHGHRYVMEVFFTRDSEELDDLGRVIDFGVIKDILGSWVDNNLDHNLILHKQDIKLGEYISQYLNQKIYYMDNNPTAENISHHILNDICPNLFKDYNVKVIKIKLFETPNCYSIASI